MATYSFFMFSKTKFLTLATVIALSSALASCSKDDDDQYNPPVPSGGSSSSEMVASPTSLDFTSNGGTQEVVIRNITGILTHNEPNWISVSCKSGSFYNITATANSSSTPRSGTIYFYSNNKLATVSVYQSAGNNQGGNQGNDQGNNQGGTNPNPGGNTNNAPSAPTNLKTRADGTSTAPYAYLSWNSSANATSYIIYRSTSAYGSYSRIGTSSTNSYADQSVKYGNSYYYKVTATNSYGTSDYSDYALCEFKDMRKPGPVIYGNCSVSGYTMTLRWSVPTDPSFGTPTKAILRVRNPQSGNYADLQTLSGSATSVSFSYGAWADSNGYVYAGIILENENGSGGGTPKIYDTKNKRWIN